MIEHCIKTGEARPIASHPYCVSGAHDKDIVEEIQNILDLDVIKVSSSGWAALIV